MDTLILYFFHEVICRLIPGIVVIGLYGQHLVGHVRDALKRSPVLMSACLLLLAWLIGATLDTLTFAPFVQIRPITHVLLPDFKQGKTAAQQTNTYANKIVAIENETDAEKFDRVQHVREQSEIELFRIMMCISGFAVLRPPTILSRIKKIRLRLYAFISFVLFLICWWFGRKLA